MEFDAWAQAKGIDLATATPAQKAVYQTAWRADTKPPVEPPKLPVAAVIPDDPKAPTSTPNFDAKMKVIEEENARVTYIHEYAEKMATQYVGNTEKIKQIKELAAAAVNDKNMDRRAFDLAMLRLDRFSGPMVFSPSKPEVNNDVIEAAMCMTHRLPGIEKRFSEQILDAAHKRFKGGMTLNNLVSLAARQAGYRGDVGGPANLLSMWQAAVRHKQMNAMDGMYAAGSGLSTIDIDGILSNTANKFLAAQFLYGEQTWRQISRIRPVNDFKQITTYRLTGSNQFVKVPPGGEIKHGQLSELSYTNQADTYGIILGIDRRDFINDDLGALTGRAAEIGQGAIDSLNSVFWTEWLDDSTFFPTDKSLANYDDGATDSVLSVAGLDNAEAIFRLQTKPNGTVLGAMPAVLLVPATLSNTAAALMSSEILVVGTTAASGPNANVFRGKYVIASSAHLDGTSTTAWYLLADPNNLAAIEVVFLFGRDMPIVEESELAFDRLGMSMRAYFDFGCNKQEYRAGVKLKGAA